MELGWKLFSQHESDLLGEWWLSTSLLWTASSHMHQLFILSHTIALTIYQSLGFLLQTENSSVSQILCSIVFLVPFGPLSRIVGRKNWAWAFVCFTCSFIFIYIYFCFWLRVLDQADHSVFQSTLNSCYHIVLHSITQYTCLDSIHSARKCLLQRCWRMVL